MRLWHRAAALRRQADQARDAGRWADAARFYHGYLRRWPNGAKAEIWVQLGNMRKELGDYHLALRAYQRSALLAPGQDEPLLQMAEAYRRMGAPGKAHALLAQAARLPCRNAARPTTATLKAPPGEPDLQLAADCARDAGRWGEAADLYERCIARKGPDVGLLVQLGNMRKEDGFNDASLAAYRQALEQEPHSPDTHLQIARLLVRMGARHRAVLAYSRASILDPAQSDVLRELAALGDIAVSDPAGWQDQDEPWPEPPGILWALPEMPPNAFLSRAFAS